MRAFLRISFSWWLVISQEKYSSFYEKPLSEVSISVEISIPSISSSPLSMSACSAISSSESILIFSNVSGA
jgi:hypothetical protein